MHKLWSQQHKHFQEYFSPKILGTSRINPGAAGREEWTLPLCYATLTPLVSSCYKEKSFTLSFISINRYHHLYLSRLSSRSGWRSRKRTGKSSDRFCLSWTTGAWQCSKLWSRGFESRQRFEPEILQRNWFHEYVEVAWQKKALSINMFLLTNLVNLRLHYLFILTNLGKLNRASEPKAVISTQGWTSRWLVKHS